MEITIEKQPVNKIVLPEVDEIAEQLQPVEINQAAELPVIKKRKRGRPKKKSKAAAAPKIEEIEEIEEIEPKDVDINEQFYATALKAIDVYIFKKPADFATQEDIFCLKLAVEDYLNNQASKTVKRVFGEYHSFIIIAGIIARRLDFDIVKESEQ